jgi:hypothetical protein
LGTFGQTACGNRRGFETARAGKGAVGGVDMEKVFVSIIGRILRAFFLLQIVKCKLQIAN